MDFVDLKTQQLRLKPKLESRIQAVLAHGQYIMGPEVFELEAQLADYAGVHQAIGCASGTDALLLALMAFNLRPGEAIFTSPFTFVATAEVISLLGAVPIFVDIDPRTFNMDPDKLELAIRALNSNDASIHPLPKFFSPNSELRTPGLIPKGIIPVDLFGVPADYDRINAIARKHGLYVIEDAAQSFGAEYQGRKAGALSDIACTSFFPAKPLGAYGDGGMCFTRDEHLAEVMRSIRIHGQGLDKYENVRIGINGRLDSLQAAVLLAKFEIFPEEIEGRQQVAASYNELLRPLSAGGALFLPQIPPGVKSAWAQYSVLARDSKARQDLIQKLKAASIPTAVYYPIPLHLQTAFSFLGYREGDFPVSEDCAGRIFSLPMHPYLKPEDQERIAKIFKE
ncbi:MAG: DegT/DnrJ/EryC1/StrS family aminotransferase [Deltaproteobacteria bacterium]|nr:DegT/DnrJ/EryC1/StrS family aminotransferase [Deltaproteobacteria bacterium]